MAAAQPTLHALDGTARASERKSFFSSLRVTASTQFDEDLPTDTVVPMDSPEEKAKMEEMATTGADNAAYVKASPFWRLAALRARKYNVERALEVLERYLAWREEFQIDTVTVHSDPLLREAVEQTVYASGNRDRSGCYLVTVRIRYTDPSKWPASYAIRATHAAIESLLVRFPEAQTRGITLINDMTGASFSNLDSRIPRGMLHAFSKTLPVRFGGAVIVRPLAILRIMFPLLRPFMSQKMKDRAHLCPSVDDMDKYIDESNREQDMGGTWTHDHAAYIKAVDDMQRAYATGGGMISTTAGSETTSPAAADTVTFV